jgi:hypothetical protein
VVLDVFNEEAFSFVSLTAAINKLPYVPGRLGSMGLFRQQGVSTTTVAIEEQDGKLQLIPTAARGTMPTVQSQPKRKVRSFIVPHIPLNDAVLADEVQNVRAFGSEDSVEAVQTRVNDKMEMMKQSHELTLEWHRIGALKGEILDADGSSVIYNLFDEFGITQEVVEFDLVNDDIKLKALEVIRLLEDILGLTTYRDLMAVCGDNFFDSLIQNASVIEGLTGVNLADKSFLNQQQERVRGIEFGDITWWNYRGKLGSTYFVDPDQCHFVPVGIPDFLWTYFAPAPFTESVNTIGKPYYAKQERMKWDLGVELHTNQNPLCICTRPKALILGTNTGSASSASA